VETGWLGEAVVTDAQGKFVIRDVARGLRSLSASHPGYDTRIVSGVSVFAKSTAEIRVELQPKSGPSPSLRLTGIGVVLTHRAGRVTVLEALAGSPAELAGMRAGDVVLAVNGAQLGFQEAIEAIRGILGTPVRLRLQRGERVFDVDVIRDEVAVPGKS
jgi:C-terminal processing protease CtpA/Prc